MTRPKERHLTITRKDTLKNGITMLYYCKGDRTDLHTCTHPYGPARQGFKICIEGSVFAVKETKNQ